MSLMDETIRLVGKPATIIRDSGNIETYMLSQEIGLIVGKRKPDPYFDYEHGFMFQPDSGIVSGDLVLSDNVYYLVMSISNEMPFGQLLYYRGMLYECNSLITIYSYSSITKKHSVTFKSDVRCLITQVRSQEWNDDKASVIKGYRGRTQPFQVFMRASEGLTKDHIIVDQSSRRYRIAKDFDPFIADGILQTQCLWETT